MSNAEQNYLFTIHREAPNSGDTLEYTAYRLHKAKSQTEAWVAFLKDYFCWFDLSKLPDVFLSSLENLRALKEMSEENIRDYISAHDAWLADTNKDEDEEEPTFDDYDLSDLFTKEDYRKLIENFDFDDLGVFDGESSFYFNGCEDGEENDFATIQEPQIVSDAELIVLEKYIDL